MDDQLARVERVRKELKADIDWTGLWEEEYKLVLKEQLQERIRTDARRQAMGDIADMLNAMQPNRISKQLE